MQSGWCVDGKRRDFVFVDTQANDLRIQRDVGAGLFCSIGKACANLTEAFLRIIEFARGGRFEPRQLAEDFLQQLW